MVGATRGRVSREDLTLTLTLTLTPTPTLTLTLARTLTRLVERMAIDDRRWRRAPRSLRLQWRSALRPDQLRDWSAGRVGNPNPNPHPHPNPNPNPNPNPYPNPNQARRRPRWFATLEIAAGEAVRYLVITPIMPPTRSWQLSLERPCMCMSLVYMACAWHAHGMGMACALHVHAR